MASKTSKREYGTGSIYYSEARKCWCAQYRAGVNANGSQKKKTIYGKTKKEVTEKLRRIQAEILTGIYTEPNKITIVQIATLLNENKKNLNIVGDDAYTRNLETIKIINKSNLSSIPIQKVTEIQISQFYSTITHYSNSVIKKVCSMLSAVYKKAIKMKIINTNLIEDIEKPHSLKATRKVNALTLQEQRKLIKALNVDKSEPYRTMLLLSLFTGARMGEICALDRKSIKKDFSSINIRRTTTRDENYNTIIGKTTKTYAGIRDITLNMQAQKLIEDYLKNHYKENRKRLLFLKNNKLITTSQINSYYKRLLVRYKICDPTDCNQHQLRHTFATRCIESGMPAKILQHTLGHTDISTTLNTYCDVFESYENKYVDKTNQYYNKHHLAV